VYIDQSELIPSLGFNLYSLEVIIDTLHAYCSLLWEELLGKMLMLRLPWT
jgi:hypothetical protein